jgi:O-antigen/teichoic acid export membrane protein
MQSRRHLTFGRELTQPSLSHRQILRSSSIIGSSSLINIIVGLARIKVAAMLMGPAGVGIIGLLQNLMAIAATIAGLGFRSIGARQIAEATGKKDFAAIASARRALFWGTAALALLGALAVFLLRFEIAIHVLADTTRAGDVGWLALGVALIVAAGSQSALLTGLRRIGDLARVSVISSFVATMIGISSLLLWGEQGLLVFVLAGPAASFLVGHWYVSRLSRIVGPSTPIAQLLAQWSVMARLGIAVTASGFVELLAEFLVRSMINRELGAESLGHFQAAWSISMTYSSLILSAMGADFYPRLTAAIQDHSSANRLVNEQTEVALLLAAPILLGILGLAPFVIDMLYSRAFGDAITILRWQTLGDIFKVVSWPLGFLILATGNGRNYFVSVTIMAGSFVFFTWFALPLLGIQAAGMGVLAMYVAYWAVAFWLCRCHSGFAWERRISLLLVAVIASSIVVFSSSALSVWLSAGLGIASATLFGAYAIHRLAELTISGGVARAINAIGQRIGSKLGMRK